MVGYFAIAKNSQGAMKHNPNPRRGRSRGNNGKRHIPVRNQTFESSGPDGKIRGTAQQVLDRYLVLGRDATSAGDPITAESFYQHAEHYYRLLHAADGDGPRIRPPETGDNSGEDESADGITASGADENGDRLPVN